MVVPALVAHIGLFAGIMAQSMDAGDMGRIMGKWDKLIEQILRGTSDANIPFNDLCGLLIRLGFERRTRGSHNVFRKAGVAKKRNLQRSGKHAKSCQVQRVRDIILKYKLGDGA
jgi:predicted RNA binding protein YcfA (HicA-like mRNA interferase family)